MNKKGFTLVELLCTITIMGFIATMVSVNIVNIFEEKEKASEISKNSIISEAACLYVDLDENKSLKENCKASSCNITTEQLIKRGLLKESDVEKLEVINITYQNNEKICQIKE